MSTSNGRWRGSSAGHGRGSFLQSRGGIRELNPSRRPMQITRQTSAQPPPPPLGQILATLSDIDLTKSTDLYEHPARIVSCEDITSYNWLNEKEPTILVPGKAPAWTPPATIQKLKEDGGNYFRDKNAARYPAHPIQPAVEAIFASQPNFPAASVHVFACSSTLGNLLRFVRGVNKPFRILVEVVGDTVFFVRRENSPTELIPDVRGYGHSFPEAYTTWEAEVKGSVSHQRIIRYKFGGLNCVVRFEADGYLKDLVSGISKPNGPLDRPKPETCNDVLTSALKKSAITERSSAPDTPLTIIHGGQQIPRTAIFDLKTRSIRKRDQDTLGEELPRLWVAQLNNFISAYHTSGVFKEIQIQNVHREVDDWERDNEDIVRRLAVLLRKIVAFAHGRRDEKLELRSQEVNVLELREQTKEAGQALPVALENRWLNRESGKSDSPRTQLEGQDYGGGSEPDDENGPLDWDEGSEKDFTACSAEDCGYCGHCSY